MFRVRSTFVDPGHLEQFIDETMISLYFRNFRSLHTPDCQRSQLDGRDYQVLSRTFKFKHTLSDACTIFVSYAISINILAGCLGGLLGSKYAKFCKFSLFGREYLIFETE